MEIIKTTVIKKTKVYKVTAVAWARPLPYKKVKDAQNRKHKSFTDKCFNCHHKFKDDDPLYIANTLHSGNIYLCKKCMEIAKKDLDEEKILK